MDISKTRRDRSLQLIREDSKPLTMRHRMSCSNIDDIDSLEEVIDMQRDMERYQKDTLRKLSLSKFIIWVYLKEGLGYTEYLEK